MILFLAIYVLGFLLFFLHLFLLPKHQRTLARISELLLLYQLVLGVGLTSLIAFGALTFDGTFVANFMSWPECPFQQELANVNLSFGLLGILCIWFRGLFWMATVLGFSFWIFGDGIHHLYNVLFEGYNSDGKISAILYTDLFSPIVLVVMLGFYLFANRSVKQNKGQ